MSGVLAVGSIFIAGCALALSIYQERQRNKDMYRTAQLEYKVNRITTRVIEKLERLKRINELVCKLHSLKYFSLSLGALETTSYEHDSEVIAIRTELIVLVKMIDDDLLDGLVKSMNRHISATGAPLNMGDIGAKKREERDRIESVAEKIHERIYELISLV